MVMVYDLCVFLSIGLQTKCFGILLAKIGVERSEDDTDDNSPLHSVIMQTLMKGASLCIPIYFQYKAYAELITMSQNIVITKNTIMMPEKLLRIAKSLIILIIVNGVLFVNIFIYNLIECCTNRTSAEEMNSKELGLKKLK